MPQRQAMMMTGACRGQCPREITHVQQGFINRARLGYLEPSNSRWLQCDLLNSPPSINQATIGAVFLFVERGPWSGTPMRVS